MCWHVFIYCSTNNAPFLAQLFCYNTLRTLWRYSVIMESEINLVYSFERLESVMGMKMPFSPQNPHPNPLANPHSYSLCNKEEIIDTA